MRARIVGDTCVLEFADDPLAFRAVLLLPLLSDLPPQPERLYHQKRVRLTGRVQRFQGRPEMVLRSPKQVELVDEGGVPPRPSEPADGAPSAPATAPPAAVGLSHPCGAARARWREAAALARTRAAALDRCLDAAEYRCGAEAAALGPAVVDLERAAKQVEGACP